MSKANRMKGTHLYGHTGNFLYCKIKGEFNHNEFLNVKVSEVVYPYCICK